MYKVESFFVHFIKITNDIGTKNKIVNTKYAIKRT